MNEYKMNLEKCNVIKTLMMLVVILCHSLAMFSKNGWGGVTPVNPDIFLGMISDWLGTFHVYTFTFVSGYIFYYLKNERNKYNNFKIAIMERAKRLIVPYLFCSIFWVIPFHIVVKPRKEKINFLKVL